jgi:hypothetical protein
MIYLPPKYDKEHVPSPLPILEKGSNTNMFMGWLLLCKRWSPFCTAFPFRWVFNKDVNKIHLQAKIITSFTAG